MLHSAAERTWVEVLSKELYGRAAREIHETLADKHPKRVIDAVVHAVCR